MLRFLLYALLLGVGITACDRLFSRVAAPVAAAENESVFPGKYVTREDLLRLGCEVSAEPQFSRSEIPSMGVMGAYALTSSQPCASRLMTIVHGMQGDDPGAWAAARGGMAAMADHYGWALERRSGRVGEYSEVGLFYQGGQFRGFVYIVQANGHLLNVQLLSDTLLPDERFEDILREKL